MSASEAMTISLFKIICLFLRFRFETQKKREVSLHLEMEYHQPERWSLSCSLSSHLIFGLALDGDGRFFYFFRYGQLDLD
jgi:hypothetical protein